MTLTSTTVRSTHTGDGTTVTFSYGFKIFSETEVAVYVAGVLKTITTHYTVSGVGSSSGGNITFETSAKPASSESIVFVRVPARTQTTDYTITGTIDPQTVEDALDKTTMLIQDIGDSSDTAFGFANTVTDAGTTKISSNASDRGSKLLAFDSSGNLAADQEIGTFQGNWAASTAYAIRDIIKDTNNNNIYICNTAHTSSGAVPISTNTDVAKWDLLVDAASASTSATAAASSASAAATSATAAASSATSSASSAASSSSSATSSASSATSSASSATSSASSSTTAGEYANKVDGAVTGTEYSSKAWALGGTGVTDTASRGAAKEWATAAEDDLVDGTEYSAKHYSLKAQAHATNAAANSGPYYSATTGTNTYVATPTPALTSYAEGVDIILKFGTANTGATTLNVSGLGAKDLTKADGSAFSSGELTSGQIQHFVYNGTEFRLMGTVAATEELIKINTLDIFQNTINDMADHSDNLLETVDGFTDNFQDGSTQNNTAFDLTNSSGVTHDNTNKLWGNTDGSTNQNSDKDYTTESNYIQQEWDETIVGANATFTNGSATVTTSATFPTNCANGRISQDGTNWYVISSRDSATQLTLSSNFGQSTVTGTFTIRMSEFDSGVVKLSGGPFGGINSDEKLVLHFDGSGGGTTFTDSSPSGHSVTANGNAQTATAQKKFGTTSGLFDGTGDYLTVPNHSDWDIMPSASSEYTIDCWIRITSSGGNHAICGIGTSSGYHWVVWVAKSSGIVHLTRYDSGSISPGYDNESFSTGGISADTWYHLAIIKGWGGSASSIACCIDGTQVGSVVTGDTWYQATSMSGVLYVGRYPYGITSYDFTGYMDELRISHAARWTSNFTPPTSAYSSTNNLSSEYVSVADSYAQSTSVSAWTDINSSAVTETLNSQNAYYWYSFDPASSYGAGTEIVIPKPATGGGITSNTKLVIHADGANNSTSFTDATGNYTLTTNGNTHVDTSIKYFGTGSAQFDGSSDYISLPDTADWNIFSATSNTFTFDMWVYVTSYPNGSGGSIIGKGPSGSDYWRFQIQTNQFSLHGFDSGGNGGINAGGHDFYSGAGSNSIGLNQWYHLAIIKGWGGDSLKLAWCVNGTQVGSVVTLGSSWTQTNPSGVLKIGESYDSATFAGYIDEFRYSNTAVWTSNFTPQSTAYSSSAVPAYIRPIAKNDGGTWKYNSNSSANNTFTAATSTVNDMLHATSQAISSEAENRLTSSEISSLADADFELTNGFTTSDSKLTRGLTLYSGSSSQNPEVSQFRVNYDSDNADGTFLTRAFGGTNMPPVPSSNINTMVALIIDKRTTGTPTYEASSNGGTTWTEFSTWVHEDLMSNGYTKRMAEIDVSAHTGARTSPLIRIKNGSTGEDYDLKAIGIKYK